MAAIQWITNAGSLGIAVELEPFSVDLKVNTGLLRAKFNLISGQLPPGLRLSEQGNISGYPVGQLSGVPLAVNEEKTFVFVIRCTNEQGSVADRTFEITVTGEDPPQPKIPQYANRSLGSYVDGTWVEIDISAYDSDPNDVLTYKILEGQLPSNLTLNDNGTITGYIEPGQFILYDQGFDTDNFDTVGFDQEVSANIRTYKFEVQISDSKIPVVAPYNITVTRSPTDHVPILLNRETDLGVILDENYFAYQFQGRDFDEASIGYQLLPILRYPTIVGNNVNPSITVNGNLVINGVTLQTTGNTVEKVSQELNYEISQNLGNVSQIQTEVRNGRLIIFSSSTANVVVGNTVLSNELGITAATYSRNANDVDIDPTADPTQLVPANLNLNSDTGWLYGFIDPLDQGEKTYDFYVRIYKISSEPGNTFNVDYAVSYPFNIINNISQSDLDNLSLNIESFNFVNSTLIFAQQDNYNSSYHGLDGTVYNTVGTGANLGWIDTNSVIVPGYQENKINSAIPNKRSGIWKFTKSISKSVVIGNTVGTSMLKLNNIDSLVLGMSVNSTNISANISAIDTANNIITIDSVLTGTININQNLTFVSNNYQLEFVQSIEQNSIAYAQRYITEYTQLGVRLGYESGEFIAPTVPNYTTQAAVNEFESLWPHKLTVTSSNNYQINWITDSDLGTIISGIPCEISFQAENLAGTEISYQLSSTNVKTVFGSYTDSTVIKLRDIDGIVTGLAVRFTNQSYVDNLPIILSVNQETNSITLSQPISVQSGSQLELIGTDLPRGLTITSNGELQGRVSHQHWRLDDHTTFDSQTTTFDRTHIFTIKAIAWLSDPEPRQIVKYRTFKLRVEEFKTHPSCNLHLEFLLESSDRELLHNTIYNDAIVPDEHVYRLDDYWFGRQDSVRMLIAYGIDSVKDEELVAAIAAYHHKKRYKFVDLRWAQSLNDNGEVKYEVIYIHTVDQYTTNDEQQLFGSIDVRPYDIELLGDFDLETADTDLFDASQSEFLQLYPASLPNMRQRLRTSLSASNRKFLPSWMTSKQPNNRELNFIPAIPLVYMKPGTGKRALYNIKQAFQQINIDALVDRYVWDDGLSLNYDKNTNTFINNNLTTFDREIVENGINVVNTADFAVSVPFYKINNARTIDLVRSGLIDGYRGDLNGKTVLFYQQENYDTLDDFIPQDGWANVSPRYDNIYGVDYETYTVITGKQELDALPATSWSPSISYSIGNLAQYNGNTFYCVSNHISSTQFDRDRFVLLSDYNQYQRVGIWKITEENGVVKLNFQQDITKLKKIVDEVVDSGNVIALTSVVNIAANLIVSGNGIAANTRVVSIDNGNNTVQLDNDIQTGLQKDSELYFQTDLENNAYYSVQIKSGTTFGGSIVTLVPPEVLGAGFTVPGFVNQAQLQTSQYGTIFDSNQTEFFDSHTDEYLNSNQGNKYIVFKKQTILDRGTVDV